MFLRFKRDFCVGIGIDDECRVFDLLSVLYMLLLFLGRWEVIKLFFFLLWIVGFIRLDLRVLYMLLVLLFVGEFFCCVGIGGVFVFVVLRELYILLLFIDVCLFIWLCIFFVCIWGWVILNVYVFSLLYILLFLLIMSDWDFWSFFNCLDVFLLGVGGFVFDIFSELYNLLFLFIDWDVSSDGFFVGGRGGFVLFCMLLVLVIDDKSLLFGLKIFLVVGFGVGLIVFWDFVLFGRWEVFCGDFVRELWFSVL